MKILIVQIGRIGDMILTTPMFRAIQERYPEARIHVVSSLPALPVIENNPRIEKLHVYTKWFVPSPLLILRLRREAYDVWIDPKDHFSRESHLLAAIGNAKMTIGFNTESRKTFDKPILSQEDNFKLQAAERNIHSLSPLGIENSAAARPELFVEQELKDSIRRLLPEKSLKILFNISAGDPSRIWEEDRWSSVIQFCEAGGAGVVLLFDPKDKWSAMNIAKCHPAIRCIDTPTIKHAIALISLCDIVVTGDTSIVHIASAFNIPQVCLFPNIEWNYLKFRPLSDLSGVVFPPAGQSFHQIPPEAVTNELQKILQAHTPRSPKRDEGIIDTR